MYEEVIGMSIVCCMYITYIRMYVFTRNLKPRVLFRSPLNAWYVHMRERQMLEQADRLNRANSSGNQQVLPLSYTGNLNGVDNLASEECSVTVEYDLLFTKNQLSYIPARTCKNA